MQMNKNLALVAQARDERDYPARIRRIYGWGDAKRRRYARYMQTPAAKKRLREHTMKAKARPYKMVNAPATPAKKKAGVLRRLFGRRGE